MIASMMEVVKRYRGVVALDHFNLSVREGEIVGLLGPNGAGKSTAIRVLCGLIASDSGETKLFNAPVEGQATEQKRRLGLVPQDLAIYENFSARENLNYFGRLYGLGGERLRRRADETLELLGLSDVGKRAVKKFSGGMKRRLNIGCAIMHEPKLLILDEPTVGVDPQSRNHILDFVQAAAKSGVTVIYTSHYMEEVERVSSRVVIMDAGRVIAEGGTEELTRSLLFEERITMELKSPSPTLVEKVRQVQGVRLAEMNGRQLQVTSEPDAGNVSRLLEISLPYGVIGVTAHTPTLEDAFLALTGKSLRDGDEE